MTGMTISLSIVRSLMAPIRGGGDDDGAPGPFTGGAHADRHGPLGGIVVAGDDQGERVVPPRRGRRLARQVGRAMAPRLASCREPNW